MSVRFAVVGDVHGAHRAMRASVRGREERLGVSVDFVIQVGDFEPHRDEVDVATMAAPRRHRRLGEFHLFRDGRETFPWPVWFIGGNHEPYGFLDRLVSGDEAAPGVHYFGRVGVADLGGLRVVGVSGFEHPEGVRAAGTRPPVSEIRGKKKRLYTWYTADDVDAALELGRCDVLVLHQWPRGALRAEHAERVRGNRRVFQVETVGSRAGRQLVEALAPRLVVAGHMHWAWRTMLPSGAAFAGVAKVGTGPDAVAIFEADERGVRELVDGGAPGAAQARPGGRL